MNFCYVFELFYVTVDTGIAPTFAGTEVNIIKVEFYSPFIEYMNEEG